MNLNILILAHQYPEHINRLIRALSHENVRIFIHIDAASDIADQIIQSEKVTVLPDEERVRVEWGRISQVHAALHLLNYAVKNSSSGYYWLISGQDFPLYPIDGILEYLHKNKGKEFVDLMAECRIGQKRETEYDRRITLYYPEWMIERSLTMRVLKKVWIKTAGGIRKTNRLFRRSLPKGLTFGHGSCWWCIDRNLAEWVLNKVETEPEIMNFYRNVLCSDESFMQTMLLSSPYSEQAMPYLHYVDWSENGNSPRNLVLEDLGRMAESGKFMARKFDPETASDLIQLLERRLAF